MPTKLAIKFTHQLAEQLPADLIYTIMQYACYKTHPTAKMIKKAVEDKYKIKHIDGELWDWCWCRINFPPSDVVDYVERENAEMFKEVDNYHLAPANWFHTLTEQYADISEEWRENLVAYRLMIIEAEVREEDDDDDDVDYRIAGSRAYELYKIISNCPTMVH